MGRCAASGFWRVPGGGFVKFAWVNSLIDCAGIGFSKRFCVRGGAARRSRGCLPRLVGLGVGHGWLRRGSRLVAPRVIPGRLIVEQLAGGGFSGAVAVAGRVSGCGGRVGMSCLGGGAALRMNRDWGGVSVNRTGWSGSGSGWRQVDF